MTIILHICKFSSNYNLDQRRNDFHVPKILVVGVQGYNPAKLSQMWANPHFEKFHNIFGQLSRAYFSKEGVRTFKLPLGTSLHSS